jgi:SAM-dependent methyltransferase
MSAGDAASLVDFHDAAQAQRWVDRMVAQRPERPAFLAAFVAALQPALPSGACVLELGSGPGHLAEQVLQHVLTIKRYDLLDFSTPMQALARERLTHWSSRIRHVQRDFKQSDWVDGLGGYDAVLTMQAVHELRHKRHVAALYAQVQTLLRPSGLFLVCDRYAGGPLKNKHADLFFTRSEQPQVLAAAGFEAVERLYEREELALYRAMRPSA